MKEAYDAWNRAVLRFADLTGMTPYLERILNWLVRRLDR